MSDFPLYPGPRMVTLLDGELVFSDSKEWRHECLARSLLTEYPLEARRDMLNALENNHGKAAADKLRATMLKLHEAAK